VLDHLAGGNDSTRVFLLCTAEDLSVLEAHECRREEDLRSLPPNMNSLRRLQKLHGRRGLGDFAQKSLGQAPQSGWSRPRASEASRFAQDVFVRTRHLTRADAGVVVLKRCRQTAAGYRLGPDGPLWQSDWLRVADAAQRLFETNANLCSTGSLGKTRACPRRSLFDRAMIATDGGRYTNRSGVVISSPDFRWRAMK